MTEIITNFQFIRPLWLWALLAVIVVYALKLKFGKDQNVWQQLIPDHLYQQMVMVKGAVSSNKFMHVAALSALIAIFAIAGPTWEKLPQAVYQTQAGKVILMDMSMSMRATDLSPNRLSRARFKAIDLINEVKEGETGLVAYAGDAFVVSPLTDDVNNLTTLIPVLSPEIMPIQGSSALIGLTRAASLLEDAGYQQGQIYWITDGIRYDEIRDVRNFITESAFDVSALLVGTEAGAPIPMQDGQLLKDFTGKIVVPSINSRYMNQAMSNTRGKYHLFANDDSDIQAIKRAVEFEQRQQSAEIENTTGDTFKDMGPYLLLLLLPIAAYSFRKGVLSVALVTCLMVGVGTNSQPAFALSVLAVTNASVMDAGAANSREAAQRAENSQNIAPSSSTSEPGLLDRVFKNADQRGKIAFDQRQYSTAQSLFKDTAWQAASAYKSGDFARAQSLYEELINTGATGDSQTANNTYNKANALAQQGMLQEALDAYSQALSINPTHEKAFANKQLVENLLEEQEQQEQEKQDQQDGQDGEQSQNDDDSQKNDENSNSDSQEQSDNQDAQDQNSSDENSQQQDDANNESGENGDQSQDSQDQSQGQDQSSNESLKQEAQRQREQEEQEAQEAQQSSANQAQPQENEAQQQSADASSQEETAQTAAISNQVNMDDLTPQQKEEPQRMQMILNKIPDDPAYLLMRKMQLEAYKRRDDPSPPIQENW